MLRAPHRRRISGAEFFGISKFGRVYQEHIDRVIHIIAFMLIEPVYMPSSI